jgi:cytochrome c553
MRDWVELRAGLALIVAVGLAALPGCASAPAATPERGQVVYSNYCAQCHKADGVGQESVGAPSIAGLPEWYVYEQLTKFRSGVRGAHYDDIEGLRMRPMALTLRTDDDVRAVSMHVASMAPVGTVATVHGDTAKGAAAFATCTACHGADGRGNEALGAPPADPAARLVPRPAARQVQGGRPWRQPEGRARQHHAPDGGHAGRRTGHGRRRQPRDDASLNRSGTRSSRTCPRRARPCA